MKEKHVIIGGLGASKGTAIGRVLLMGDENQIPAEGDIVLVAETIPPSVVEFGKNIKAFITDEGGLLSHAATVARELMIPCVVGAGNATKVLKEGQLIEVSGDNGEVYLYTQ